MKIRHRGQSVWNLDIELNGNELSTCRRPNAKFGRDAGYFLFCPKCGGGFTATTLSRHFNKCTNNLLKGEKLAQELGRAAENRIHLKASEELSKVFSKLRINRANIYVRTVRFDWLLIAYGNELCLNHSADYQHGYIRSKLRAAAKILVASKSLSTEITDLASLFHVKHCNTVVEAIRKMSKFDSQTNLFGSPGTALTSITLMNTVGDLLVVESMKMEDFEKETNVKRFLTVFKRDVRTKICKLAATTKSIRKRHKKLNIPTLEDVNKLALFLDSERDAVFNQMNEEYSYQNWIKLSELTLASVLLFNRRRTGEMRNILVDDFREREIIADSCDPSLDYVPLRTKQQIKSRMHIRGKLERPVPALLLFSLDDCIETLLRHRKDVGVPDSNEFLFGLPAKLNRIKTVDACAVLRSFSVACGAKNPTSLRGTNLRKHMASFCATKNLSDNDVTNVANFMGHADKVHRDIYRHNTLNREVAQMTSLLSAASGRYEGYSSDSDGAMSEDEDVVDSEQEEITPTGSVKRKYIRKQVPNKLQKYSSESLKNQSSSLVQKKKVIEKATHKKKIRGRRPKQAQKNSSHHRMNRRGTVATKKITLERQPKKIYKKNKQ